MGNNGDETFVARVTARPLRHIVAAKFRQSVPLSVLGDILGEEGRWSWAHSIGACTEAEIAAALPAVPPLEFRRINAAEEPELFLRRGLVDAQRFIDAYEAHGSPPATRPARILDFGCGCGRVARFLSLRPDLWQVHGSDVNRDLVDWCRQNLPNFEATTNERQPPLDYPDRFFDMVYSFSVFSHTPEELTQLWLAEIARLLPPGGVLSVTTMGLHALTVLRGSEVTRERFEMTTEIVEQLTGDIETSGFASRPQPDLPRAMGDVGPGYGLSFVLPDRVASAWIGELYDLVDQQVGVINNWQDLTVLVRR